MCRCSHSEEIETVRAEMIRVFEQRHSLCDHDVIKISQQLDSLLNAYHYNVTKRV
ncbi:Spo0E like sporulation regulatory protein [compost metagenome]